jgi:hypothetical protein
MSREPNKPYEVGYGRPPLHSRFQPGQCGNPRGRPKGQPNIATELKLALAQKVVVTENGKRRKIRKSEAIIVGLVNRAAKGNPRDVANLFQVLSRVGLSGPDRTPEAAEDNPGVDALLQLFWRTRNPTSSDEA